MKLSPDARSLLDRILTKTHDGEITGRDLQAIAPPSLNPDEAKERNELFDAGYLTWKQGYDAFYVAQRPTTWDLSQDATAVTLTFLDADMRTYDGPLIGGEHRPQDPRS